LRSQSKCTQNVIGGYIGRKMIQSPQFTQDVPTGFQVTSPPVSLLLSFRAHSRWSHCFDHCPPLLLLLSPLLFLFTLIMLFPQSLLFVSLKCFSHLPSCLRCLAHLRQGSPWSQTPPSLPSPHSPLGRSRLMDSPVTGDKGHLPSRQIVSFCWVCVKFAHHFSSLCPHYVHWVFSNICPSFYHTLPTLCLLGFLKHLSLVFQFTLVFITNI